MKPFYLLFFFGSVLSLKAQIIFQDKFNSYALSTFTTPYSTTQYTTIPAPYLQLCEGYPNKAGSSLNPNAPFHTDSLRYKAWGIVFHPSIKDTFLVSTSAVDSNRAISRWFILPPISGITVNSVLYWKAMAPDMNYADGYAVYISTNTTINDTVIFSNANKVFQINDNSTSGGGEKSQWITRSINLSNYAGQSIRIAFKNISRQKYQLWIDDITIENLPYSNDASLENIGNVKYIYVNQPFVLQARIKNNGYQKINNFNLAYSIQGITNNNQSFGLSNPLLPLNTTTLTFTNTLSINTSGMYKVKIWVNQLNGIADQNPFNDTISYYLSVLSNTIQPKILVEQLTDAFIPDAPGNQDTLSFLAQQDTNIIVVQMHQKDSMQSNASSVCSTVFQLPDNSLSAMLNRRYYFNDNRNYFYKNELRQKINILQSSDVTPCKIYFSNVAFDTINRTIQFDVNVQFFQNTTGDYRIGAYLIENNVYGNPSDTTINGYNQLSSFYFTPFSPYYQKGYYSPLADAFVLNSYQYQHKYVLNQSITSPLGDATLIPTTTVASSIYSKTYTVSVPLSANNVFRYHFNNFYLVAFVYEHDSLIENRKILNVTLRKLTSGPEIVNVLTYPCLDTVIVYPNPASHYLYIKVKYAQKFYAEIFNIMGEKIISTTSEIIDISELSEGIYFVNIITKDKVIVKKIMVKN
ncbi:MAG: choice-of-anchor J domain-containing protein [Bacteroidia bacterium]|nr:choice-of-anchor J domain-containing protein [Bacteroidia bacterium]